MQTKRQRRRERLIRQMRRAHVAAARLPRQHAPMWLAKMRASLASGMTGLPQRQPALKPRTPMTAASRMDMLASRWRPKADPKAWAHCSSEARAKCKHRKTRKAGKHWRQCVRCNWCVPRTKQPVYRKIPALLKDRPLPPLFEDDQLKTSLRGMYTVAGVALSRFARLKLLQLTWKTNPVLDRFSVELKFRDVGWKCVAIVYVTHWHKVLALLERAHPKKMRRLFVAIQRALDQRWPEPWLPPPWKRRGTWIPYWDKTQIGYVKNDVVCYRNRKA